jgi:undecaprenyl-diphosphatase
VERAFQVDLAVLLWLNGWVGHFLWMDRAVKLLVGDYLVPVLLALLLFGAWFTGNGLESRERHQRGVMRAMIAMGFASLAVWLLNQHFSRPRPFVDLDLALLFYRPTDSSFPSNPAVVGFALATGLWTGTRSLGGIAYALAAAWSLSRVYAGVSYPSDVAAGALLGIAVTVVVCEAFLALEPLPAWTLRVARRFYLA